MESDLSKYSDRSLPDCQPVAVMKSISAEGYCKTCENYLCKDCYNVHILPNPIKHHVLLDNTNTRTSVVQGKPVYTFFRQYMFLNYPT